MKILIHFNVRKQNKIFEAAQLKRHIIAACEKTNVEVVEKHEKNVNIANFIDLRGKSTSLIRYYAMRGVPTLLWMFYASTDADAEIVRRKKSGERYIPKHKLATINMMDAIVVPSVEAKLYLRKLKIRIPVFTIRNGVRPDFYAQLEKLGKEPFLRYFRANDEQKYVISIINIREQNEKIPILNKLAKAAPSHNFYVFVSARKTLLSKLRLRGIDKFTAKNLIVSPIVREDVYRAGLYGASFFFGFSEIKLGMMSLVEIIASRTAVIINKNAIFGDVLNKENAFIITNPNEVANILTKRSDYLVKADKAMEYTTKYNQTTFAIEVCDLFKKIYHH